MKLLSQLVHYTYAVKYANVCADMYHGLQSMNENVKNPDSTFVGTL